jgi:hypothetical protein
MGSVYLQQFYPLNGKVNATEVNNNYNAVAGTGNLINADNVTSQGVVREHFDFNGKILVQDASILSNEYYKSTGSTLSTDAQYISLTDPSIVTANKTSWVDREHPINHGSSSGLASTNFNQGTAIAVGGPDGGGGSLGLQIPGGSILHVYWNFVVWRNQLNTSAIAYFSKLVDSSTTAVSGIGTDSWIVYPKFNTVSGTGPWTLGDWKKPDSAGLSLDSWMNPPDGIIALGGGGGVADPNTTGLNNLKPFADKRNDHWTWVPHLMGTGGSTAGGAKDHVAVPVCNGEIGSPVTSAALFGPKNHSGQTYIKVNNNTTLYGIQLFVAGFYNTHYDPVSGKNTVYPVDQAWNNVNGGFDGYLHIERAQIGYTIYRPEGV